MRVVVGWLPPDSHFPFQHQVRQRHKMHRKQGMIFADIQTTFADFTG